jgi:phenylacetate-CoA ligase
MSIYTNLIAGVVFPLHERLKGLDTTRVYRELMHTQWLPRKAIEALRLQRLRELLTHAHRDVPYFRRLFDDLGFKPDQVNSLDDLTRLPLLTKDIIRTKRDELFGASPNKLRLFSTTGSTGDPLQFYLSSARTAHTVAAKWRATTWWGVDIGDREIVAWSSPIEVTAQDRLRGLRDLIMRSKLLPTTSLTPGRADELLEEIRAFRPRMLFGYPSTLALLAERAIELRMDLTQLGTRVAFVTAERSYPHQRELISKAFGCRVADGYGGRDSGFIAHECPDGGMHITAEDIIVEIVDQNGNRLPAGKPGEVVVTHLFSFGFPFIRYKNGDVAVASDRVCKCGRELPLIDEVRGRTNDFLIAQNGAKIHDVSFAMLLRDMPGVTQFKIVQETLTHIHLQLVVGPEFDSGSADPKIRDLFERTLGKGVELQIERVESIPPERTGKYRYVVCKI